MPFIKSFNCILKYNNPYLVDSLSTDNTICYGGNDGSLYIKSIGGTTNDDTYTYILKQVNDDLITSFNIDTLSGINANFLDLSFGNYYVETKDIRGCPLTSDTVPLNEPGEIIITPTQTAASCFDVEDVTLTATVLGGTSPYTLVWKDIDETVIDNTNTINVGQGIYILEVVDSKNCGYGRTSPNLTPVQFRFNVDLPDSLIVSIDNQFDVDSATLSNGSVSLSSEGGWSNHQYSMDGTNYQLQPIFNGLSAGDYTFYVRDGSNCQNTLTTTITEPAGFIVTLDNSATSDVNCFAGTDGQIVINATGGRPPYSFSLDDGNGTTVTQESNAFAGLPAGTYTVTTGYNTYAHVIDNIVIGQPASALSSTISSYQSPKCTFADGQATVTASGGTSPYSYRWSNLQTAATATGLRSGGYFVEVSDFNNCTDTAFVTLYDIAGPELSINQINNIPCFDSDNEGSITLNVSGGNEPYNIQWNDPNNQTGLTASNLGVGNYSATVTDGDGCISILENIPVTRPEQLFTTLLNFKDPSCYNGANGEITVEGNGGTVPYSFQWQNIDGNPETATVTGLGAGNYEVVITDINNCTATESFQLNNPEEIIIDLADSVFICQGQTATLDAGNVGSLFQWSSENGFESDQQIVNIQEQGDYTIIVSNINGCSNSKRIHIKHENRQLEAAFLLASEATMADTVILIEISWPVPDSVEWTIPDNFMRLTDGEAYKELIPLQTGEYTIAMKAYMAGCHDIIEKTITILPAGSQQSENKVAKSLIQEARLFPNPNSGVFEVEVKLAYETDIRVDVFSMKGKTNDADKI